MTRKSITAGAYVAAAVLSVAVAPKSFGQAAPAASPAAEPAAQDEVVVLSPFVVSASDADSGYAVKDTLAGTRVRTDLKDIASSISVVNAKFMQDTGATNNQTLLQYTANTEVGGVGGNFAGVGNTFVQGVSEGTALLRPSQNTRVRGLDSADNTRDFFQSEIPWDGYIVDRVDLQRGPNSILFGLGSPAGIINASLNTAGFKTGGKFENRLGSFGSVRNSFDYTQVILEDELSFRVSALHDDTKYRQKPAFQKDKRLFGAVRWDPKLFAIDGAKTTIRANVEVGDINANRPRTLPPIDKITPWFMTGTDDGATSADGTRVWAATKPNNWNWAGQTPNNLNRATIEPYYAWLHGALPSNAGGYWDNRESWNSANTATDYSNWYAGYMSTGMQTTANPVFTYTADGSTPTSTPWQASPNQYYGIGVFNGGNDSDPSNDYTYRDAGIQGFPFARLVGVAGMYLYSQNAGLPGALTGAWKDKTLSDSSVFDFYNKLIDGDTKREWQKWNTYNVALEQSFFNGRLAFQAVVDHQDYQDGFHRLFGQNQEVPAISVDVNSYLLDYPALIGVGNQAGASNYHHTPYTDAGNALQAVKNPNAGKAFVASAFGSGTNQSYESIRDAIRFTLAGEVRASDFLGKGKLADILGRHSFTALWSNDKQKTDTRSWASAALPVEYATLMGKGIRLSDGARIPDWVAYLSDDLRSVTSASGLDLPAISSNKVPYGSTVIKYFDSTWNSTVDPMAPWINEAVRSSDDTRTSTQSENPANYVGWTTATFNILNADKGDIDSLYMDGSRIKKSIDSQAFTYQGYFWDETIVPTLGWRKDTLTQRAGNAPINASTGAVSMDYDYSSRTKTSGESTSWGLVMHTPKFLRNKLPLGTTLDLFINQSENTRVETRYGFDGELLPDTTGKTTDYGFAINTLNDKLQLKVSKYKTKVKNASIAYGETGTLGANTYYMYLLESWSLARAVTDLVGLSGGPAPSGGYTAYASPDSGWSMGAWYLPPVLEHPSTIQNIAAIKAALAGQMSQATYDAYGFQVDRAALAGIDVSAMIAGTVPVSSIYSTTNAGTPDETTSITGISNWVYNKQGIGDIQALGKGRINGTYPMGTIDNTSEGLEFELTAQPFRNWSITVNASKTKATRTAIGKEVVAVLEAKYRKWVGANPGNYKQDLYYLDASGKVEVDSNGKALSRLTTGSTNVYTTINGSNVYYNIPGGYYYDRNDTVTNNGTTYYKALSAPVTSAPGGSAAAGDLRLWWAGDNTIRQYFLNNLWYPYQFQLQACELQAEAPELNPWRVNVITNLSFDDNFLPKLKGFNVGGAFRWQQGNILGYELDAEGIALDVNKPFRGDAEAVFDLWVGYNRKLTNKVDWRIQLNLREVGKKARLVPLSVEPDGSVATARIAEGMTWQITNTFSF